MRKEQQVFSQGSALTWHYENRQTEHDMHGTFLHHISVIPWICCAGWRWIDPQNEAQTVCCTIFSVNSNKWHHLCDMLTHAGDKKEKRFPVPTGPVCSNCFWNWEAVIIQSCLTLARLAFFILHCNPIRLHSSRCWLTTFVKPCLGICNDVEVFRDQQLAPPPKKGCLKKKSLIYLCC